MINQLQLPSLMYALAFILFLSTCGSVAGSGSASAQASAKTHNGGTKSTEIVRTVAVVTSVIVVSTSAPTQISAPIAIGQLFRARDFPAGPLLQRRDAVGNSVLLQTDEISSHSEG